MVAGGYDVARTGTEQSGEKTPQEKAMQTMYGTCGDDVMTRSTLLFAIVIFSVLPNDPKPGGTHIFVYDGFSVFFA